MRRRRLRGRGSAPEAGAARAVTDERTEPGSKSSPREARGADLEAAQRSCASEFGVSPAIHPQDLLLDFLLEHPTFDAPADAVRYYFEDGAESARRLGGIVERNLPARAGDHYSVLEFASGYGMVTRHLPDVLDRADVVSCDIHPEAVDFLRDELGVRAVLSSHAPEDFPLEEEFDVVFALSFFSHMPPESFGRWLAALYARVKTGGILAFTTHGVTSAQEMFPGVELPDDGFFFRPASEQVDLDGAEYGSSVTTPDYVIGELYRRAAAPIREFRQGYWWNHQDLYVVPRPPAT